MSEGPTTDPDWYALGVRMVEAVERLGAALEQIPTGPPLDRCPACDRRDRREGRRCYPTLTRAQRAAQTCVASVESIRVTVITA